MKARIFATIIIFFLLGIGIHELLIIQITNLLYISTIIFISSFFVYRFKYLFVIIAVFSALLFGYSLSDIQYKKFVQLNLNFAEKEQNFQAIIDEIPVKTEFGYMAKIRTQKINNKDEEYRINAYFRQNIKYNEVINFESKISQYQDEKRGKLIKEKVIGEIFVNEFQVLDVVPQKSLKSVLYIFRQKINEIINNVLPTEEANLASGLILGEKALVSAEMKRYLQAAGVSHIIALSGYNITILLGIFAFSTNRLSRRVNLFLPLILILFFVIMTGGSASIIRAGIMGFMPILAKFLFRPKNTFMAILFSAFLMILVNPFVFVYDVGFQLSFAAMFGLCYLTPIITKLFGDKKYLAINLLAETLGAQIAVLPLLIFYFGRISIISPLSNLVILLFVPVGMLVSFLVGISGLLSLSFAEILAIPAYVILKLINSMIVFFGSFSFSSIQFKFDNPLWIFVMYLLIFNLYLFQKNGSHARP